MTLLEELTRLVHELHADGVEYALVGGLAVAVWGAPRATQDIDLLVRREALDGAMAAAARCGFVLPAVLMTFRDGSDVQRVSKVDDGALMTVDFLVVGAALEPIWASRQRIELTGESLWVVGRDALIAMKSAAGRPQDLLDVQSLREIDR